MTSRVKATKGWVLAHPNYGMNLASCRWMRRDVVAYANADSAPGWDWPRYRKNGWSIVRVLISPAPISAEKEGE